MRTLKFKGELYTCGAPRSAESGLYTCDAWKQKTGREVRNYETLDALGRMLMRRKKGSV